MLYYEWKKIWVRRGTKVAMFVLACTFAIVCWFAVHNEYYMNENGEHEYGILAIHKLKEAKKEWTGELTEEVIAKVIAENRRINGTEEGRSDDIRLSNIAYGWKQGFHDIRNLLMNSYCKFREADYYKPDSLMPEDAASFYGNRLLHLQEWLAKEEQQYIFSEKEREFLIERYAALQTPFTYDYADGWKQIFELSSTIIMIMMLILSFVAAGIFAGEFTDKADAVFYSSYHGRGKASIAKLGAGILFITCVYVVVMALYTGVLLLLLGADGADLMIQTNLTGWKSFYFLTNIQEYWLIVLGGYIGTLFMLVLTMLVSAATKSKMLAVVVPFVLIFLRSFLTAAPGSFAGKLLGIWPDTLLDIYYGVVRFDLYEIGGKVVGALPIVFVLYTVLTAIVCPFIYQVFRKKEAG
ncbi:MAG: ABC transporter permease [Ruminococcus sp.]|nr:ABC transporter permease [Ruminococcus sp.]